MIELFKTPNIDWMGKAKYFYALSAILLIAGWTSIFLKGGPAGGGLPYSIDFKGGTNVDVRFAQPPNIEKLRSGLSAQGLGGSEIQTISDIASSNTNEVLIFVGQKGQAEEAGEASKTRILTALNAIYGVQNSSKPDFNAATPATLATFLTQRDPLLLSTNAGDRYQQLAKKILDYRDTNSQGVLTNFDELSKVEGVTPAVLSTLKDNYALGSFAIRGVEIVGPKVGGELRRQAIYVTLYALAGMLVYIAFRFELVYGAAAVLGGVSRRFDHAGLFLAAAFRDFADGHRGASHTGWIFDERYHRHLRPHPGEQSFAAPRAVYGYREHSPSIRRSPERY